MANIQIQNQCQNKSRIGRLIFPQNVGKKKPTFPKRVSVLGYPESNSEDLQWEKETGPSLPGVSNDSQVFNRVVKQGNNRPEPDKIYRCTKAFLWGETKKNNYYKLLSCGKEWCKDCGKMHSYAHDLKAAPLIPKFRGLFFGQGVSVGYLVVTVPAQLRKHFRNKQVLNDFRTYWRRKMRRYLEENNLPICGLTRYHWAGENGYDWKPHLNILFPSDWIELETLHEWRMDCAQWFKNYFRLDELPKPNLWYNFERHDFKKVTFWIRYITRPTQTKYNELNAETIHKYRNTAPFGKFPPDPEPDEKSDCLAMEIQADGTKEPIIWRKRWDALKNRFVPETVSIHHVRLDKLELVARGFWKEEKYFVKIEPEKRKHEPQNRPNPVITTSRRRPGIQLFCSWKKEND